MNGGRERRLLEFGYELGSATNLDELRLIVAAGVRRLVPCELASCTQIELVSGRVIAPLDPPIGPHPSVANLGHCAHQHPLIMSEYDDARTISDHMTARQFHRLELYHDVYRPLEAEDQLAIKLHADSQIVVGVALNRSQRSFDHHDRDMLEQLRPVLIRAYRRLLGRERDPASVARLTARERDVLCLLAAGHTNQQIAAALDVSRRTIENHLQSIYPKLGVHNRTAAAARYRLAT
jgi:DNA-binding CsgD family transcriptional regulator